MQIGPKEEEAQLETGLLDEEREIEARRYGSEEAGEMTRSLLEEDEELKYED